MDNIHIRIRTLREEFGFSQCYVGDRLGISQQAYSNYEKNKGTIPVKHAVELAKLYHVSTDYLLGMEEDPPDVLCMDAEYIKDITYRQLVDRLMKLDEEERMEMMDYLSFQQKRELHSID